MKAILFTKHLECELTVVESLHSDVHLNIVRSENDIEPNYLFELALFDLTWEDDFIRSKLQKLNIPGIAIVQLESPVRLANAYLSGIKAMVFMENIREDIQTAMSRIAKKNLSFPPAVAKSILEILSKKSKLSEKQVQFLKRLSQGKSTAQIADDLGFDVDEINIEIWILCSLYNK